MPNKNDDDEVLYQLFQNRCPCCKRRATTIHELEPRARGSSSMRFSNRVPIDFECHENYHRLGASDARVAEWHGYIEQYLKSIGTWEEYVGRI